MNELDNQNDPFEEVFRNRFADFESEPDSQLWNKIEPQLPVDSTRVFPYWQISTVIILMLLLGWSVYRNDQPKEAKTLVDNALSGKSITEHSDNQIVTQKYDSKSFTEKSLVPTKINAEEAPSTEFSETRSTNLEAPQQGLENEVFTAKTTTINPNDNLFIAKNSSENNLNSPNEIPQYSRISYQEKSISEEKKNAITTLNSRQYHWLDSDFKMIKIKPIIKPKEDEYFKETQPIDVYMSVMPLMNYYTITPEGNEANYVHNITINNDADRLGFYTEAGAIFTLSDRFKLRAGLTFTKTNHSIDYSVRTDSLIVQSPNNQTIDVSFAELDKTYSQIANYLGTKVELQYILLKGEPLTHYVNVGLEGAYRLNGNHQFNGFANIAYGVSRQIGKNTYLFVEPTFSYSLNQQSDKNSFLLVKPNKIGFNIGVNIKVK